MALRTANGDLPGLYGGTLDTTTCDAELMINYLGENPNKARAWAGVHRINPDQIRGYVTELTPVLLRTDTRLTDHGYIEVGQSIPRQAVLQAGTAVMVDKYGSPRVRCISGSPLLDPVALTAAAPARGQAPAPAARPAGNVAVQPAAAPARPRVIFVGLRWPRFDPATIVVIRRIARIIEYFLIWDFRRGALIARRIGILLRDIANLLDPRLARIVPVNLLPRPVPARPPVQAPLPLQPPRPAPQRPPVQGFPAQVPPVQGLPAQVPPVQQAPPPAAPPVQLVPAAPTAAPPPIVDTWDPPIYDPGPSLVDPPIWNPPYDPDPPVHVPSAPSISGPVQQAPVNDGTGTHVPAITDPCSNPAYPCLPQAPISGGSMSGGGMPEHPQAVAPADPPASSGGGHSETAPIYQPPAAVEPPSSGGHETGSIYDPPPVEVPQDTGSGGYTEPDYGSLPGPSDGSGQCDPVYGCY